MKATAQLLVAALAAAGLASVAPDARAERGHSGGGTHFSGSHGWSGGYRGSYGGPRWYGGGSWGGHRSHWYGPRVGFSFGVPVVLGLGYWGSPYYWGYPRETVVYREVIREPAEGDAPTDQEAPPAEPAPSSAPLYMNYCESAKAYYPKARSCPEGWKFITPTR